MSEQQIQKVKVKRLSHVGLWSTDVAAQARFYRQVLGLDLRNTVDNSIDQDVELENANVFLSLGEEHHCLGLFSDTRPGTGNGRSPFQRTRLHHLSFEVDTDAEFAALAADGSIFRLVVSVPRCSLRRRCGARHPRHARAPGRSARGSGWLCSSHLLHCAPWLGRCQVGTEKQARRSN